MNLEKQTLAQQAERHHEERRSWRDEDKAEARAANKRHDGNLRNLVLIALLRPLIELAILIVLLVKL